MTRKAVSVNGRKPPPVKYRFLKGKSGNPRGRPKGSVSQRTTARRVALKKIQVSYGGEPVNQTVLEHLLDVLKREAARGIPSMITEFSRISNKLQPPPEERRGGFLVVPKPLTEQEGIAQAEKHNATAHDPSLPYEPDPEAEARAATARRDQALVDAEVAKARKGLPSPLGEAMLTFQRKWG
jgi:hypothetical protein